MPSLLKFFCSSPRHPASSPLVSAAVIVYHFSSLIRLSLYSYYSFSSSSFLLSLSLSLSWVHRATIIHCFFFIWIHWPPGHLILPPNDDTSDELAKRGALLQKSRAPCLSRLISRIHTSLLSGRRLSHQNFSTRRSPQYPLGNLCFLVTFAIPSPVFAATNSLLLNQWFPTWGS